MGMEKARIEHALPLTMEVQTSHLPHLVELLLQNPDATSWAVTSESVAEGKRMVRLSNNSYSWLTQQLLKKVEEK